MYFIALHQPESHIIILNNTSVVCIPFECYVFDNNNNNNNNTFLSGKIRQVTRLKNRKLIAIGQKDHVKLRRKHNSQSNASKTTKAQRRSSLTKTHISTN